MTNRNYGLYALAAAIAFVGALALGVPLGTLAWLTLVAACPLMMYFMMRGMHDSGGHAGHDASDKDQPAGMTTRPGPAAPDARPAESSR